MRGIAFLTTACMCAAILMPSTHAAARTSIEPALGRSPSSSGDLKQWVYGSGLFSTGHFVEAEVIEGRGLIRIVPPDSYEPVTAVVTCVYVAYYQLGLDSGFDVRMSALGTDGAEWFISLDIRWNPIPWLVPEGAVTTEATQDARCSAPRPNEPILGFFDVFE